MRTIFTRAYLIPIFLLMYFDTTPRFFQGDSISYLSTSIGGWMPPDRSWEFGLFVNFLLRATHSLSFFIILQICVLIIVIEAIKVFFPKKTIGFTFWGLTGFLIALDPLIEVYTRFYMTDFLAMSFYIGFLVGALLLVQNTSTKRNTSFGITLALLGALGCLYLRISYSLIILSTIIITALFMIRQLNRKKLFALTLLAAIPLFASSCIMVTNHFVFAKEFPGQFFTSRISKEGLVSIFSPALTKSDFAKAGIPITQNEYNNLDLSNYQKRNTQVFGTEHNDLIQLIKDNLHIQGDYKEATGQASERLFKSALINNPSGLLKVYSYNFLATLEPSQWSLTAQSALGLDRKLPAGFLKLVNQYSTQKITADSSTTQSFLVNFCSEALSFYPFQLCLSLLSGIFLLIKTKQKLEVSILFSAFIANFFIIPLYELLMIPRFFLADICLGYILIGLAICNFFMRSNIYSD